MKRNIQVLLLLLSGAGLLHIALFSDMYLRYVKEGLRVPLILSGVLLVALGLVGAARDGFPFAGPDTGGDEHFEEEENADATDHGHDHRRGPRVAWLLFLPALTLLFFTPPALGSYTAARERDPAAEEQQRFPALPRTSPVPLALSDFQARARQDTARSLEDRRVRLTGFVTPGKGGVWYLTRLVLSCCAADSRSVKVEMRGLPEPPADSWVSVTGTWRPSGTPGTPSARAALDADDVEHIAQPANPYMDSVPRL
ncbi:TIGR03943 family putative permease subunit [Streptomyces sp. NPDC001922]|uniref:TIGR03943 family putative permease subunit n=1 Tax=Streptomyces sp. NPDC001922 TaxID=3364624 RepID=UPI00369CE867